jgi:hypothetical protein
MKNDLARNIDKYFQIPKNGLTYDTDFSAVE